ncbi:MAG: C40 family peptidase [Bacteroidia bacterium]
MRLYVLRLSVFFKKGSKAVFLYLSFICVVKAQTVSADTLLAFAGKQMGIHYKYGSINPKNGFDCSGFVYYVFRHFKIDVPRASMDYESLGDRIPLDSCRPGDVIVFTGTKAENRVPGHVGIVVSGRGDEVTFIHSSSGKKRNGVIISDFKGSPFYKKRFIKIVRIRAVS